MSRFRKRREPRERRVSLTRPGSRGSTNVWRRAPRETENIKKSPKTPKDFKKIFFHLGSAVIAIILVVSVSFALLYAYRYFTSAKYFALKTVEIRGNARLSSRNILDLVHVSENSNLLDLSISNIEASLIKNPWVKEASVTRVMPDTLIIRVKENTPAFWQLDQGILIYADMFGKPIAPVELGQISPLPFLEVEKGAEDVMAALPELVRSLYGASIPLDMRKITKVRLSASRGVELSAEDNRVWITIGLEEWLDNLKRLGSTISDLKIRGDFDKVISIRAQGANVWVEQNTPVAGT